MIGGAFVSSIKSYSHWNITENFVSKVLVTRVEADTTKVL